VWHQKIEGMSKQSKHMWQRTKFVVDAVEAVDAVVDVMLSLTSRLALIQAYTEKAKNCEWCAIRECLFLTL
jgi:hypothetical protein